MCAASASSTARIPGGPRETASSARLRTREASRTRLVSAPPGRRQQEPVDSQAVLEKLQALEKYKVEEEKDRKREEQQRRKDMADAKKRVAREIANKQRQVRSRSQEVKKLQQKLSRIEQQEVTKVQQNRQQALQLEETLRRVGQSHSETESQLHEKVSQVGEARGTLAYLEYAQAMLERGTAMGLGEVLSALSDSSHAEGLSGGGGSTERLGGVGPREERLYRASSLHEELERLRAQNDALHSELRAASTATQAQGPPMQLANGGHSLAFTPPLRARLDAPVAPPFPAFGGGSAAAAAAAAERPSFASLEQTGGHSSKDLPPHPEFPCSGASTVSLADPPTPLSSRMVLQQYGCGGAGAGAGGGVSEWQSHSRPSTPSRRDPVPPGSSGSTTAQHCGCAGGGQSYILRQVSQPRLSSHPLQLAAQQPLRVAAAAAVRSVQVLATQEGQLGNSMTKLRSAPRSEGGVTATPDSLWVNPVLPWTMAAAATASSSSLRASSQSLAATPGGGGSQQVQRLTSAPWVQAAPCAATAPPRHGIAAWRGASPTATIVVPALAQAAAAGAPVAVPSTRLHASARELTPPSTRPHMHVQLRPAPQQPNEFQVELVEPVATFGPNR